MLVIGIAGGSGSGKTTVVKAISENIKGEKVVIIPQDSYYKDSSDLTDEEKRHHNFDHPDAIDWDLLCQQLAELKSGKTIHRDQMDIKIFVDADDDDRLMRVMARDITERGKDVRWVIERYTNTVKPMYLQFIEPSKRYADIIIPQGGHNKVAIDVISATIEKSLVNKQ